MSDNPATEHSLAAIYARAIDLAADRLAVMDDAQPNDEFDRDARSVGTLVRTAMQVNALKASREKEAAALDEDAAPTPPSEDDLAAYKAEIMARLARVSGEKSDPCDPEPRDRGELSGGGRP